MSDLSDQVDDMQDEVDDHEDRLETAEDTVSDHENRLETVEGYVGDGTAIGQLTFPLNADTISYIQQVFPCGTVQLQSGTATVQNPLIGVNSTVIYCVAAVSGYTPSIPSGGGPYASYSYTLAPGQVTFNSSISADTSTLAYFISP
jgi:hypothetical protein